MQILFFTYFSIILPHTLLASLTTVILKHKMGKMKNCIKFEIVNVMQ